MKTTLLIFLTLLLTNCTNKDVVRSEVVKIAIDESLLQTPLYTHEKAQNEKDVIMSYVKLYSFYLDLYSKINTIKKLNECFKSGKAECLKREEKDE